ncbi:putative PGAP1 family protein [Paraburkholderia piptadeniae]|uniref:PGAP1 family protein n=1 Tax=Paraburkholderia piptadeniae TaxID=1701573 RepID=A0A1N7RPS4_9BURK|nr:hypothetical protein [Paraburkholderia piptadeniae]SIT37108.1 putative PGAP1 family protein [Paraburkholderia piptadeniae]
MATQRTLSGGAASIEIGRGGYALQAPLVHGTITEMTAEENATRSGSGVLEPALLNALTGAEIHVTKTFEMEVTQIDRFPQPGVTRAGGGFVTEQGEPAILLRMPSLGDDVAHAVLFTDEAGVSRWIFPRPTVSDLTAKRRGADLEFLLPRDCAMLPSTVRDAPGTRGPLTKFGRRLVRVLAWATEDIVGHGALAFASDWERKRRPYALRRFPFDDPTPVSFDALLRGRTLLLLHGTFSTSRAGFELLPRETCDRLSTFYGGRMFAFDHPTLHESPDQNVERLLEMLPPGTDLEIDILTHSRGGLLGRELTERQSDFPNSGRKLRVRRAVFVAAPHRGTIITDSQHGIEMLDHYTNLFTDLPDDAFTIGTEALFMIAKLAYHGAAVALPGLKSMYPSGDYLKRLNAEANHSTEYYAIASDFKPTSSSFLLQLGWKAASAAVNGVFGEANDGVVPTAGCYETGMVSSGFPIAAANRIVFDQSEAVHHCNYFGHPGTSQQVVEWLTG